MAAGVLVPAAWAQELPEVAPDCPSHVRQQQAAAAEVFVTQEQVPATNLVSTSRDVRLKPGPLTVSDRMHLFLYQTGSTANLSTVALQTSYATALGDPLYGRGPVGYTKMYGAKFADGASRNFLHTVVLSHAFGHDPRVYRSDSKHFFGRVGDVASSVVVTRTNDGRKTFNSSRILATFLSSALSNAYYPQDERGFDNTLRRTGRRLMFDVTNGMVREFAPDLMRKLFRKKKTADDAAPIALD